MELIDLLRSLDNVTRESYRLPDGSIVMASGFSSDGFRVLVCVEPNGNIVINDSLRSAMIQI